MPKRRASVLSASVLGLLFGWSSGALAQDTPPAEPPPAPPAEPAPPPAQPPPAEPPPAAPAEPPPAPPPATPAPPPSDAFPLPPETPPPQQKPAPRPAPPPAAPTPAPSFDEPAPAPAPAPAEEAQPKRATEGLFEEKRPVPPDAQRDEEEEEDETDHFKIGPVVGVGLPSVFSIGGTIKLTRFIGAGANIGIIPTVQLSYYGDATLSYQHYDIYGRLYPMGGGFFLQGGAGYATVDGTLTKTVGANTTVTYNGQTFNLPATFAYESEGSVRTLMLTALIGYFHTTSIGFSFGVDAGAQIPIAPSQVKYSRTVPMLPGLSAMQQQTLEDAYVKPIDDSVKDTLETIGRSVIPTANLRIGWIL
jgi:hypothetical protein